jgi:ethanolamine utilization microcompartment shell protein EutL
MEALGRIHSDIATIKNDVDWMKKSIEATKSDVKTKDTENKKQYAPRWVIYPLITTASVALTAVIGALMGLILVPPARAIALVYIKLLS